MTELKSAEQSRTARVAMLAILGLTYGAQYLNLILLGLLIQPIKADFALTDTQAGLLTGIAFTATFVILGIPLARMADRYSRKLIVFASALLFSIATAACGLTVGFMSLFILRMIVAIGESGTVPASVSMLTDAFPLRERRLALSLHSCGSYFGTAICLLFVGLAGSSLSWRHIFGVAGGFGLILSILLLVAVREPARGSGETVPQSFLQDARRLAGIKSFVCLALALGVMSISTAAAINWVPAFLARSYGMDQRQIVLFLAAVWGIAATSGGMISGILTNWLYRLGGKWPLVAIGSLMALFPIICCIAFLSTNATVTMIAFAFALFLVGGVRGPTFAAVQDIVPANARATANSFLMFSMYAIGITLGPLLTGAVSDLFVKSLGAESLRYALLVVISVAGVVGAFLSYAAAVTIEDAMSDAA